MAEQTKPKFIVEPTGPDFSTSGDAEFKHIAARYSEPHRAYHNLGHIGAMFDLLGSRPFVVERPALLTLAIWYHDAVYDPRAADNEEASAKLFRDFAMRANLQPEIADWVSGLIMATKSHEPGTNDQAVLVDLDLAILGASEAEFDAYEAAIRREYAFVADDAFVAGRTRILESFLCRPQIYRTALMVDYESRARANIARSIASLRSR